jgi:hypothetical protein
LLRSRLDLHLCNGSSFSNLSSAPARRPLRFDDPPSDGPEPESDININADIHGRLHILQANNQHLQIDNQRLRIQRNTARLQRDACETHCVMIRDHAETLQRQLNLKHSKTRRTVRIPSGIVSSAEGREIAHAQHEKRKEREAAKKAIKARKENELSTNTQLRMTAGKQGLRFSGALTGQKLLELRNIAWSLDLDESGTRESLIQRIRDHCSVDINIHLRSSEQYGPLFGQKILCRSSSAVHNIPAITQSPIWPMSPPSTAAPFLQPPPGSISQCNDGLWVYTDAFQQTTASPISAASLGSVVDVPEPEVHLSLVEPFATPN